MKTKEQPKRNYKNYIIPIVLTILILGILGVYAGTTISNNPTSYLVSDNVTLNNTGLYYKTSSDQVKLTKTADIVICRGTSLLDDLIKGFTCDVVCKSTDNDCGNDYNSVAVSGKVYFFKYGYYPIVTPLNIMNNSIYDFSNSILSSNASSNDILYVYNVSNVELKNFNAILNITASSNQVNGVDIQNSSNIKVHDFSIQNADDQDFSSKFSNNILIYNFLINGAGRNGIFIGFDNSFVTIKDGTIKNISGSTQEGYCIMVGDGFTNDITIDNVKMLNCHLYGLGGGAISRMKVIDSTINGSSTEPDIAVKLWSCKDCEFTNNYIRGSNVGFEILETPTTGSDGVTNDPMNITDNVKLIGNTIYNTTQMGIRSGFTGFGTDYGHGSNIKIIGNTINNTGKDSIDCSSLNCQIIGNTISNSAWNGIWLHGNTTSQIQDGFVVEDNIISNVANSYSGIRLQNSKNSLITNNVISDSDSNMVYGVNSLSYNYNTSVSNNRISGTNNPVSGDNYGYFEGYQYTGAISLVSCSNSSAVNGKYITNGTSISLCTGGSWLKVI